MKRILKAYRELFSILLKESPFLVIAALLSSIIIGLLIPFSATVTSRIFDYGVLVASGAIPFSDYLPWLGLFTLVSLVPVLIGDLFISTYVEPRCLLIIRTAYKGKMLKKLSRIRYDQFETEASMEIIDKAYYKTENAVRQMFPHYVSVFLSSGIASIGTLCLFASVRWWLLLTLLVPFIIETAFITKGNNDVYQEMESYWKKERRYTILGDMLKSREYVKENHLLQCSDYLIDTYAQRMRRRNKEYERFYFAHLKKCFTRQNITKLAQIGNAFLLLALFLNGQLSIGLLIALTLSIFSVIYGPAALSGCSLFFRSIGYHVQCFSYYDQYFSLPEEEYGEQDELPEKFTIEFKDVSFHYPNSEKTILKGLSFTVGHQEKVSVVGANGEGKTTIIKLMLGLFEPDSGAILIGGKPLSAYSQAARIRLFGPVFQDYVRYAITMGENVGVGDIAHIGDQQSLMAALHKVHGVRIADSLPNGLNTLLGREFEGGADLSGGQWQRIAIARAFMGNKPILIFDEPTSLLDPLAESNLYTEFMELAANKTSLFITHRLASTVLTDRILVIADGKVTETGTHEELMRQGGLYAEMFCAQKHWYIKENGGESDAK